MIILNYDSNTKTSTVYSPLLNKTFSVRLEGEIDENNENFKHYNVRKIEKYVVDSNQQKNLTGIKINQDSLISKLECL